MPFTLLLDLDDTLLDTNIEAFIPAYFSALSASLADIATPEVMLPALMGGTKKMMSNQDPGLTLRQVFDAYFYPTLGIEEQTLKEKIDHFYENIFPTLGDVTCPRPQAVEFVEWAFAAGHRVAIATNPYFPLKAVEHRMRWASLPPEKYPYALISSYERFHFTKETGAYFHEFLGQLGWPDGPVVMVGNDLDMDLLPAQRVGFPVFWLRTEQGEEQNQIPQGNFWDLKRWLEGSEPGRLLPKVDGPDAILAALQATPAALATLTLSLDTGSWLEAPAPGEWCPTEILCHLKDVEQDINLARLKKMINEENPLLTGVDSDTWVEERAYTHQDGRAALLSFIETRKKVVELLISIPGIWDRPARHTFFGPTTAGELLRITSDHDRIHIRQMWQTLVTAGHFG